MCVKQLAHFLDYGKWATILILFAPQRYGLFVFFILHDFSVKLNVSYMNVT